MLKALARQIHEAKTPNERKLADLRLQQHIRNRRQEGMDPKQVEAAIKAWLTRLAKWEKENDPRA